MQGSIRRNRYKILCALGGLMLGCVCLADRADETPAPDKPATTAPAEAKGKVRAAGKALFARLEAALQTADLSADQQSKVKAVFEDAKKQIAELRGAGQAGDREALRAKVKSIMEDIRSKLKDILTPEQAEKVKAAMAASAPNSAGTAKPAN